jgi:hypothetical protein
MSSKRSLAPAEPTASASGTAHTAAPRRWEEVAITVALVALFVVGALTVFDDEIARWRGQDAPAETVRPEDVPAPSVPGNTKGTL